MSARLPMHRGVRDGAGYLQVTQGMSMAGCGLPRIMIDTSGGLLELDVLQRREEAHTAVDVRRNRSRRF